jgi:hypothetical protein
MHERRSARRRTPRGRRHRAGRPAFARTRLVSGWRAWRTRRTRRITRAPVKWGRCWKPAWCAVWARTRHGRLWSAAVPACAEELAWRRAARKAKRRQLGKYRLWWERRWRPAWRAMTVRRAPVRLTGRPCHWARAMVPARTLIELVRCIPDGETVCAYQRGRNADTKWSKLTFPATPALAPSRSSRVRAPVSPTAAHAGCTRAASRAGRACPDQSCMRCVSAQLVSAGAGTLLLVDGAQRTRVCLEACHALTAWQPVVVWPCMLVWRAAECVDTLNLIEV